jgi:hypothetical protein
MKENRRHIHIKLVSIMEDVAFLIARVSKIVQMDKNMLLYDQCFDAALTKAKNGGEQRVGRLLNSG